jgi:ATP-dependent DNA helicase RecG
LYSNYENAILYLQKNLRTRFVISDAGPRKEVLEIPEDVLREAVLNALVHRDYFDKGAGVSIEIYSDRIEVSNPGGLVAGLNPRDFGKKSLSRNPLLFGLVHRRGLVEKAGSGIARMRLAMGNAGLAEPEFEFDSFFTVVLKRPVLETTLKAAPKTTLKTTQKILGFLKENPRATREELAVAFGITVDGVKYHLSGLKKSGLLKRVGGRKSGSWVVVGGIEGDGGVFKLRYYCQGAGNEKSEEILSLLRKISEKHGVNFEVVDLSTNGKYDAARENEVYDEDFKPRAKLLKARTGVPVTRLRSRKARTYFVSIPGTLAVVRNGVVEWFALNDGSVAVFLEKVLNGGVSSIMELLR